MQCHGGGFLWRITAFVPIDKIAQCAAIRGDISAKAPLLPQYFRQQSAASAARLAVQPVVCSHHTGNAASHRLFKCRQICFPQVMLADPCVKRMARALRPRMRGKMLRAGGSFQKFAVALYSVYISRGKKRSEKRILAERLLPSAPARVTENIYIRRPKGKPLINIIVAVFFMLIVFDASLCGYHIRDIMYQHTVKCCGKPYRMRKDSCCAASCHAMRAFIPPVVFMYSEPLYGRRIVEKLRCFLLYGHF